MMLDHLSHTITELGSSDKWAQFEVIILDKNKIYHKFNWQVEKYTQDGVLKDCWLTTMVSNPIPLAAQFNYPQIQFCFVISKNLVGIADENKN